jgi:hypothetical protein
MMVEAEATEPPGTWSRPGQDRPDRGGRRRGPRGRQEVSSRCCARPRPSSPAKAAKPTRSSRASWTTRTTCMPPSRPRCRPRTAPRPDHRRQAGARGPLDEIKDAAATRSVREPGPFDRSREGGLGGVPLGAEEARPRAHPARQGPHRRPWPARHPRPVAEVEVLPRVHGSAIFERGETQIMGVTTLNMLKMEQQLDTLSR